MLIELSAQLVDNLEILLKDRMFIRCVKNLALAFYEGKHVVTGPIDLIKILESSKSIPADTQNIFRIIRQKRIESEILKSKIAMHVVVSWKNGNTVIDYKNPKQVYTVSYEWFADSVRVQSARLLCENKNDAEIYHRMARAFLWASKYRGVALAFRPSGCGGPGIADRLEEITTSEGASLCIVDSDRKWPDAPLGDTARCLQKAAKKLEKIVTVAAIIILDCHELENIIPAKLVFESISPDSSAGVRQKFETLHKLNLLGAASTNWHFDLKAGMLEWDLHKQEGEARDFLSGIALRVKALAGKRNPSCGDAPDCFKRDECKCVLIDGLSDTMLDMIVKHLEKLTPQKLAEQTFLGEESASRVYWEDLCSVLFAWGCAYNPSRV